MLYCEFIHVVPSVILIFSINGAFTPLLIHYGLLPAQIYFATVIVIVSASTVNVYVPASATLML